VIRSSNIILYFQRTTVWCDVVIKLYELSQYTKCESKAEALATIHVVKTLINQVKEMESVNVGNIF